jgi:hypothetical protein
MEVIFGRGNGEQTRGTVTKLNRVKAKVKTIDARGVAFAGAEWSVPYSMMRPAGGAVGQVVNQQPPIAYFPFSHIDNLILEAINACYSELSPENLTCDGEASPAQVNAKRVKLNRQLRGLFQAYGREVDEKTALCWFQEKIWFTDRQAIEAVAVDARLKR